MSSNSLLVKVKTSKAYCFNSISKSLINLTTLSVDKDKKTNHVKKNKEILHKKGIGKANLIQESFVYKV